MQKRLAKHLRATDGNLGREGREIKLLSRLSGASVSMIQSVALGRRKFSDSMQAAVDRQLRKLEQLEKDRRQAVRRG